MKDAVFERCTSTQRRRDAEISAENALGMKERLRVGVRESPFTLVDVGMSGVRRSR
jgi:hypothetical protein